MKKEKKEKEEKNLYGLIDTENITKAPLSNILVFSKNDC